MEGRKKTFLQRPTGLSLMRNFIPKHSRWRSLWRIVSCGRDPRLEQGQDSSPGGGSTRRRDQHVMNWPQFPLLISLPHCEDGGRELGVKLALRRTKRWEEGVFKIWFASLYPTLILIENKLIFSPWVCFPCEVFAGWSLPVLTSAQETFVIFSFPCPAEEGVTEQLWWAPYIWLGLTYYSIPYAGSWVTPDWAASQGISV